MAATVMINGMTVVHASSGGTSTAFPDTCKTPAPSGTVPIPYPNVAMSSDTADASTSVKADGNGVCVQGSNFSTSSGDEAGSAGGGGLEQDQRQSRVHQLLLRRAVRWQARGAGARQHAAQRQEHAALPRDAVSGGLPPTMPTGRIVALGGHTSLGPMLRAAAAARAGLCNAQEIAQIGCAAAPEGLAGHPIEGLDPALTGLDRLVAIAAPGLGELRAALDASGHLAHRTAVYLGLPRSADAADGAAGVRARWSAELGAAFGQVPELVALFPEGRAGTLQAIAAACAALESGSCELAVVGGLESKLDPTALADLAAKGRLKCAEWPVGLVPGEAAVFLAMERAGGGSNG